jgi:hypothetical protein
MDENLALSLLTARLAGQPFNTPGPRPFYHLTFVWFPSSFFRSHVSHL